MIIKNLEKWVKKTNPKDFLKNISWCVVASK